MEEKVKEAKEENAKEMKEKDCKCKSEQKECECKEKSEHKHHKHNKEVEELKNLVRELQDKNLRTQAELINYRTRKDEEVARMMKYANEDIALELLPIVDNFERAIKMDSSDETIGKFLEGFKMIYCHLVQVLENFEVKAIDGYNKPFDPTYHQAVFTSKDETKESGIVLEVLQKGYMYKDKVLRPSMVKVSE